jgi:hypothetical protein
MLRLFDYESEGRLGRGVLVGQQVDYGTGDIVGLPLPDART